MRRAIAIIAVCTATSAAAQSYSKQDAERYIMQSERAWTASSVSGDPSVAERILANDYFGVLPDGSVVNKYQALDAFKEPLYVSNRIVSLHVRFFGDTAIAQGAETWVARSGNPRSAQFIWLDVWVLRNGRWQIVNSEDLLPAE
jgi:hypothetical protein